MFTIRRHKDDKDMLEIISRRDLGRIMVWAVMHEDFIHEAIPGEDTREEFLSLIRSGEEIDLELKKA